jgi:hypothetical protein
MHPLVKGAGAAALLAALGPAAAARPAPAAAELPAGASVVLGDGDLASRQRLACPERSLALGEGSAGLCVTLPAAEVPLGGGARARRLAEMPPSPTYLRQSAPSELVPRLPERPEAWGDYQLPVDPFVAVDVPEEPREADERPRLGIEIVCDGHSPVSLVDLEGQVGRAEVVLVGDLYGVTVVVRQRVKAPQGERDYLVFYGHLESPGPQVVSGATLAPLAVIGQVAETGDGESSLYLEVRHQRSALDRPAEHLSQLVQSGVSVAVDPRNVLPLHR